MHTKHITFEAIGTRWELQVFEVVDAQVWIALLASIHARIEAFDKAYSRFRKDSLVTEISKHAGTYAMPKDWRELSAFYRELYEATDGKVTPLIGQAISDAGYDAQYSFKKKQLYSPPAWDAVLQYDESSLTITQPVLLDFGAAGKGYLVDIISQLFDASGIASYVINASGDILHRSYENSSIAVGMENPADTSEAIGIIQLSNKSLCASAGSKRAWADIHHIIDPVTLTSPSDIIATWVLADTTMLADGLASALFFTDAQKLSKTFSFDYAILDKDMQLYHTENFPITIFNEASV
jgi:thiamine biosynthesis lipoprotein